MGLPHFGSLAVTLSTIVIVVVSIILVSLSLSLLLIFVCFITLYSLRGGFCRLRYLLRELRLILHREA